METDPRLYCVTRSLWQRMRTISTLICRQARSRNTVGARFILCTRPPCGWPVWEWASVDRRRKHAISCRFFSPMEPGPGAIHSQEPISICIWRQGAVDHRCVCGSDNSMRAQRMRPFRFQSNPSSASSRRRSSGMDATSSPIAPRSRGASSCVR